MKTSRRVSLKQIAQHANVSAPVVSAVLNNSRTRASASEATRRRILEIAEQQGYQPHAGAQAVSRGRFNAVGLVMPQGAGRSHLPQDLLMGIHNGLDEVGLSVSIHLLGSKLSEDDRPLPRILRERMVDGLLLNYTHDIPELLIRTVDRFGTPAVWINTRIPKHCVYIDDHGGAFEATRHLLRRGHRRIAYVDYTHAADFSSQQHYSVVDRRAGYEQAMRQAGLIPRILCGEYHDPRLAAETSHALLTEQPRPTAVLSYATSHAATVMMAATRCGLDIPKDLSVLSFSNRRNISGGLGLAVMKIPFEEAGIAAARAVVKRIAGEGDVSRSIPMQLHADYTLAEVHSSS